MLENNKTKDILLSVISSGELTGQQFNELALGMFGHQFQNNLPYQNYCKTLETTPANLCHWHDIPAVSTDFFKVGTLPLISFPREKTKHTFLTSGTTSEARGQHHFPSLELYERSVIGAWRELNLPRPRRAIFLIPPPEHSPQSSLSHMMGVISRTFAESSTWAIDPNGKLDIKTLSRAVDGREPVALLGTSLAFLHLFGQLNTPLALPTGSWALETGGYKGTRRGIGKENLYTLFQEKLTLPPDSILNEYSMTELSSQFYTRGLGGLHSGPSWTRVRVTDPLTASDALTGEPGHLVIYDLANLHSVMAIRTQDIAIAGSEENNNSFTLLGRDPSAFPRGCSRAADETIMTHDAYPP